MLRKCSGWQYNLLGVGKNFCIKTLNLHLTFGCKFHVFNNMMNSYFLGCMFVQVSWKPNYSYQSRWESIIFPMILMWIDQATCLENLRLTDIDATFLFSSSIWESCRLLSILRPENDPFPLVAHSENKIIFNNSFTDS